MYEIMYTLRFTSDAELGTGTGSDNNDGYIPRDMYGNPYIPATHLKGIMRDELRNISQLRNWIKFEHTVFGEPDSSGSNNGIAYFMDAKIDENSAANTTIFISRTAINEMTGIAEKGSLRRTEAIRKGTVFKGKILINSHNNLHHDAVKLSLLAVTNLGGTKSRGKGCCMITIANDSNDIGSYLNNVDKVINPESSDAPVAVSEQGSTAEASGLSMPSGDIGNKVVWKRIIFTPINPLCCPEQPNKTNVIKSGFAVPASAVQGAILTKINSYDSDLATKCFDSDQFRTWPLHPAPKGYAESIRVSLTHKVAKLLRYDTDPIKDEFIQDSAIEPYDWTKLPPNSPLKASDGVLIRDSKNKIRLWKSIAMPRVITAHGVINDNTAGGGRNLYQVEAMATHSIEGQIVWTGIIALPEKAAICLKEIEKNDNYISLGRSRGVRGLGTFTLEDLESPVKNTQNYQTILITQSPVLLDNNEDNTKSIKSIQTEFSKLIESWCTDNQLPPLERDADDSAVWCTAGIRFGWNNEKKATGRNNRISAARVILPGAVFCLSGKADQDKLEKALLKGLGKGKERGFGCIVQHIGKAEALYEPTAAEPPKRKSKAGTVEAIKLILDLFHTTNIDQLPSASQISSLQQQINVNGSDNSVAKEYLRRQRDDRPDNIRQIWDKCGNTLKNLLDNYSPQIAQDSLQMLRNLILSKNKKDSTERNS